MTIIKNKATSNFTTILNSTIRDSRLSFKARGLHHLLLSYPPNWEIRLSHLVEQSDPDGETAIRSGMAELQEAGYLEKIRVRNEDGTTKHWETHVYEVPAKENQNPDHPDVENPHCGKATCGEAQTKKELDLRNTDLTKELSSEQTPEKQPKSTSAKQKKEWEALELLEFFNTEKPGAWKRAIRLTGERKRLTLKFIKDNGGNITEAKAALKAVILEMKKNEWWANTDLSMEKILREKNYQEFLESAGSAEPPFQEYTDANGYIITANGYREPGSTIEYNGRPPAIPVDQGSLEKRAAGNPVKYEAGISPMQRILEKAEALRAKKNDQRQG